MKDRDECLGRKGFLPGEETLGIMDPLRAVGKEEGTRDSEMRGSVEWSVDTGN